jgi:hypothetical protein
MIENNRYFWSHLKTKNVTVRVSPREESAGSVFRVSSMIDLGNGRQTVILDYMAGGAGERGQICKEGMSIPFRMGNLDFIYTSQKNAAIQTVDALLSSLCKAGSRVEKIVTDVLAPGDLLVFRQQAKAKKIKMIDALRVVKESAFTQSKAEHAV